MLGFDEMAHLGQPVGHLPDACPALDVFPVEFRSAEDVKNILLILRPGRNELQGDKVFGGRHLHASARATDCPLNDELLVIRLGDLEVDDESSFRVHHADEVGAGVLPRVLPPKVVKPGGGEDVFNLLDILTVGQDDEIEVVGHAGVGPGVDGVTADERVWETCRPEDGGELFRGANPIPVRI